MPYVVTWNKKVVAVAGYEASVEAMGRAQALGLTRLCVRRLQPGDVVHQEAQAHIVALSRKASGEDVVDRLVEAMAVA